MNRHKAFPEKRDYRSIRQKNCILTLTTTFSKASKWPAVLVMHL